MTDISEVKREFYTLKEVATKLGVGKHTVRRLILGGKLSVTIIGKQYRISEVHLQEFYQRNTLTVQTRSKE